jgi:hypothetical protein
VETPVFLVAVLYDLNFTNAVSLLGMFGFVVAFGSGCVSLTIPFDGEE